MLYVQGILADLESQSARPGVEGQAESSDDIVSAGEDKSVTSPCAADHPGIVENSSSEEDDEEEIEELKQLHDELVKANKEYERKNNALSLSIHDEREAVVEARVRLRCMHYKNMSNNRTIE